MDGAKLRSLKNRTLKEAARSMLAAGPGNAMPANDVAAPRLSARVIESSARFAWLVALRHSVHVFGTNHIAGLSFFCERFLGLPLIDFK